MKSKRPCALALLCAVVLTVFSSCGKAPFGREEHLAVSGNFSMGSFVSASAYSYGDASRASRAAASAVAKLGEKLTATGGKSEICRLNGRGEGSVSPEVASILSDAARIAEKSGGALRLNIGRVSELWGFTGDAPHLPDPGVLAAALPTVSPENIVIDGRTVRLLNGAKLDPGAFGKGAGLDAAADALGKAGAAGLVDFGGSILFFGRRSEEPVWTLGVRDPFGEGGDYFATLVFTPETEDFKVCASTSGVYEKAFSENGKTYHHILDPETGYPAENGLVSVTAVSASGVGSDALSTALFVMGCTKDAVALAEEEGMGAVFVFEDGSVYVTPGLKEIFTLTGEGFALTEELA